MGAIRVPEVTVEQQVAELRRIEALDEQPAAMAELFARGPQTAQRGTRHVTSLVLNAPE